MNIALSFICNLLEKKKIHSNLHLFCENMNVALVEWWTLKVKIKVYIKMLWQKKAAVQIFHYHIFIDVQVVSLGGHFALLCRNLKKKLPLSLKRLSNIKKIGRFFRIFVAFSEYLNFTKLFFYALELTFSGCFEHVERYWVPLHWCKASYWVSLHWWGLHWCTASDHL